MPERYSSEYFVQLGQIIGTVHELYLGEELGEECEYVLDAGAHLVLAKFLIHEALGLIEHHAPVGALLEPGLRLVKICGLMALRVFADMGE